MDLFNDIELFTQIVLQTADKFSILYEKVDYDTTVTTLEHILKLNL